MKGKERDSIAPSSKDSFVAKRSPISLDFLSSILVRQRIKTQEEIKFNGV